jgi:hypothetical protein
METTVHKRWLVITDHRDVDMSNGRSVLPLTWQTTVTDMRAGWQICQVARYPTEQSAHRGHNKVVRHLRGGGTPNTFNR